MTTENKQEFKRAPVKRRVRREPLFGELVRGVYASENNPQRDGMYVETIVRKGRMNPGKFYRLTDGRGKFWMYWAEDTVLLTPNYILDILIDAKHCVK